jgi:hypothetical protein
MTMNMNIWLAQKARWKGLNISCIMVDAKDLKDGKKDFVVAPDESESRVKDTYHFLLLRRWQWRERCSVSDRFGLVILREAADVFQAIL